MARGWISGFVLWEFIADDLEDFGCGLLADARPEKCCSGVVVERQRVQAFVEVEAWSVKTSLLVFFEQPELPNFALRISCAA